MAKHKDLANKYYKPGKFTTLIAFEWTSIPSNQNLHRNVFFRDDKGPDATFSAFDSDRPEDLWTYIQTQRDMGKKVFAIPHNGNLSNELMFAPRNSDGTPIDARYAKLRASIEVATEILQTKGQSDTHPALSPNDEFAGFEKQYSHMIGTNPPVLSRINYSYVREALINGVGYQEFLGANPFKYGIVAGADAHTAFSDNEEFNYNGVHGAVDATMKVRMSGAGQTAGESATFFGTPGATATRLAHTIAQRVGRYLERQGLVERDTGSVCLTPEALDASDDDPSNQLLGSSITYRIAVGPQQGRKVFTLQTLPNLESDNPFSGSVGTSAGFSLHAGVATNANEREKLERLCRYITRPAVSTKRLSMTRNGRVRYELKTPWRNGTTHVIFEPLDFISRLVSLVPKPRVNLTRFDLQGCNECRGRRDAQERPWCFRVEQSVLGAGNSCKAR